MRYTLDCGKAHELQIQGYDPLEYFLLCFCHFLVPEAQLNATPAQPV